MITRTEVEKLGAVHAVEPTVLSLYLAVPVDPAQLHGLPAHASELLARVRPAGQLRRTDRQNVLAKVATLGQDWLGRGVAIFCCSSTGLFEVYRMPGHPPERAILGTRPHIRPLLAAIQRYPAYRAVVVDRQHASVLAIDWDEIATVADLTAATMPGPASGGWHGLEPYLVHTANILAQLTRQGEQRPLVIGGLHDDIRELLGSLPPHVRDTFAGSFAADTHATSARVRDLAAPVVSRWAEQCEQRLAAELKRLPAGQAAIGLDACLTAVNAEAAEFLVVPQDGLVAGFACGRCGALDTATDHCPDWGTAAQPVPDLIEEMVVRTLEDDGQVSVLHDVHGGIAAKLRFLFIRWPRGSSRWRRRGIRWRRCRSLCSSHSRSRSRQSRA